MKGSFANDNAVPAGYGARFGSQESSKNSCERVLYFSKDLSRDSGATIVSIVLTLRPNFFAVRSLARVVTARVCGPSIVDPKNWTVG